MQGGTAAPATTAKVKVRITVAKNFFMNVSRNRVKVNCYERMLTDLRPVSDFGF